MKTISQYVYELCLERKMERIWIGEHELLNMAYAKYLESKGIEITSVKAYKRIKNAWNSVTRDVVRFNKTGRYIRSVLFSNKQYRHPVFEVVNEIL